MDSVRPSLEDFTAHFAAQLEETDAALIAPETEFRQLAEWSSMQSLIVIASFDWEYGVTMSAEEMKSARTVADLYAIVKPKIA
ncbi:MAG: acyl carrier protein [Bacteroidota bacterium]